MAAAWRLAALVLLLWQLQDYAWSNVARQAQARTAGPPRVALITGASTGLGLATAQGLAQSYGLVILAGRDELKHQRALATLRKDAEGTEFRHVPCDLDSLTSVRRCAQEILAMKVPLDCLVLNAGVMALPQRQETSDGHEYQLGVNYLGHFLLANLLLDHMASSASHGDPGRVISLSSSAHLIPSSLQRGNLGNLQSKDYTPWQAYGQSKLANLLFAYELDRRCRVRGVPIASNAVHPGAVATELKRHLNAEKNTDSALEGAYETAKGLVQPLLDLIVQSPQDGAKTSVLLATQEEGKLSGHYWQESRPSASLDVEVQGLLPPPQRALRIVSRLVKALQPPEPEPTSYDPTTWRRLWDQSEKLVGLSDQERPGVLH
ncbi:unnamed protein product [Effrenium voratum]|nr:unnamed protein product [Effrenium voratum]